MTAVFISYSKKDFQQASALALFLEAQGLTVWWDKSIEPGDDFQLVIHSRLNAARTVVVIWSRNSVTSTWVRAEAAAAMSQDKLIPVRTPDLDHDLIPPPFNLRHTESLDALDKLTDSIRSRMSAPAPRPLLSKQLKYQLLSWAGVIGGSMTILNNIGSFLQLANWAKLLTEYWHQLAGVVFRALAGFFSLRFPEDAVGIFTFIVCMAGAATGARYLGSAHQAHRPKKHLRRSALLVAVTLMAFLIDVLAMPRGLAPFGMFVLIYGYFWGLVRLRGENSRLASVIYAICIATVYGAFFYLFVEGATRKFGLGSPKSDVYVYGLLIAVVLPAYMFFVAGAKPLLLRLVYVAVVVAMVVSLSELSNFYVNFRPSAG
jgi:hypothetical protein